MKSDKSFPIFIVLLILHPQTQFSIPDDLKKLVTYVRDWPRWLPHIPAINPESTQHWPALKKEIKVCCNLPDVESESGYNTHPATGCSVSHINVRMPNHEYNPTGDNETLALHDV